MPYKSGKGLFPEIRDMITAARAYMAGEIKFNQLYEPLTKPKPITLAYVATPILQEVAADWCSNYIWRWNEWDMYPERKEAVENEFRTWLAEQLRMFEPFDPVAAAMAAKTEKAESRST